MARVCHTSQDSCRGGSVENRAYSIGISYRPVSCMDSMPTTIACLQQWIYTETSTIHRRSTGHDLGAVWLELAFHGSSLGCMESGTVVYAPTETNGPLYVSIAVLISNPADRAKTPVPWLYRCSASANIAPVQFRVTVAPELSPPHFRMYLQVVNTNGAQASCSSHSPSSPNSERYVYSSVPSHQLTLHPHSSTPLYFHSRIHHST